MSKIFDLTPTYKLIRNYIVFAFKRYYGEYIVLGKENIPANCPVIFAPNHTNALMDALAVVSATPPQIPVIFLARADLFNNKTAAKALKFSKIMPAFRMRDGVENLNKNAEIFNRCVEILDNNHSLCIMPEGNQEIERKLRPLAKGIFRIAFSAQQRYGSEKGIKIIPVGLDFGNLFKSGKHIIINFGKPIEVSEYMNEYGSNPVNATNHIRKHLQNELGNISLNLNSNKYYYSFETATEVCNSAMVAQLNLKDNATNRFLARLKIAKKLVFLEKHHSPKAEKLDALCTEYVSILKEFNLHNCVLEKAPFKTSGLIASALMLLFTFPIFLYGFITNFFPYFTPVFLRKKVFKPEFSGFISSLQFALGILVFPVFYTLETILFTGHTTFPWWVSLIFLLSLFPAGKLAQKWNEAAQRFEVRLRYITIKQKKKKKLKQAQNLREQILRIVL